MFVLGVWEWGVGGWGPALPVFIFEPHMNEVWYQSGPGWPGLVVATGSDLEMPRPKVKCQNRQDIIDAGPQLGHVLMQATDPVVEGTRRWAQLGSPPRGGWLCVIWFHVFDP